MSRIYNYSPEKKRISRKSPRSGCFRNSISGEFFCKLRSFIATCKKQKHPISQSILYVFNFSKFQFACEYLTPPQSITTPRRIRERSDRPGFSSFLVTFFCSFHKEKKKVTKRFEIKEKF